MHASIAIVINVAAIIWFIIFLNHSQLAVLLGVSAIIWFFVYLYRKQNEVENNFQKRFVGKNIILLDKSVIFRAQESYGYSQSSGKGYLVLTEEELYFEMILLSKDLSIPISSIKNAMQTHRLLGVNPGRPMLKVEFQDRTGKMDSIALNVKDLSLWIKTITETINANA